MSNIKELVDQRQQIAQARKVLVDDLTAHLYRFRPFADLGDEVLASVAESAIVQVEQMEVSRVEEERARAEREEANLAQLEAERDKRSADELAEENAGGRSAS